MLFFLRNDYSNSSDFNPKHPLFSSSHWGMHIIDAKSKKVLYSYNSARLFIPASITKLVTAASALEILSPSYTFTTIIKSSAPPDGEGVINGNLYLVGGGDPTLNTQVLKELAVRVYDKGVRSISGKLIADDSLFDGVSLPEHGEWQDLAMSFASEQSALSINDNVVMLEIHPNSSGRGLADIQIRQDSPYCQLINQVETVRDIQTASITQSRGFENNIIKIKGMIPANHPPETVLISIHQPQEYARCIFLRALQDLGIDVVEKNPHNILEATYEIARIESPPLSSIIEKMNKNSHNLIADLLFKHLCKHNEGDAWASIFSRAINPMHPLLNDGSGRSRHNLITPQQTVKILEYENDSTYKDIFVKTLPVGGIDGTLTHRFKHIPPGVVIQAKTGNMSGISNLAGFIQTPTRGQMIFAIFINNSLYPQEQTIEALDELLLQMIYKD